MAFAELTIRSTVLHMDTKINVIIPESRRNYLDDKPGKKYKALYILHGSCEDNSTWMNSSNLYLLARDMDLFVFMPSGYNMSYVDTKFGMNVHTYITEELPYKMARLFPISTAREDTFIMGESMGGFGTWYSTIMCPEKYGKACVLSATGIREFKQIYDTGAGSIDKLIKEKYDTGADFPEYLIMAGTDDMVFDQCISWNEFVKKECPNIRIKEEYWPGKHDFFFWNQAIPKALEFFGFQINQSNINQL